MAIPLPPSEASLYSKVFVTLPYISVFVVFLACVGSTLLFLVAVTLPPFTLKSILAFNLASLFMLISFPPLAIVIPAPELIVPSILMSAGFNSTSVSSPPKRKYSEPFILKDTKEFKLSSLIFLSLNTFFIVSSVGVIKVKEPTLNTPVLPTTKPFGLANNTSPPICPFL